MRAMCRAAVEQLLTQGFVIVPEENRELAGIHAVAVPFSTLEFAVPILFECRATREALSFTRMQQEVVPALRELVRKRDSRTANLPLLSQNH